MRADALGLFWQDMPKVKKKKKEFDRIAPPEPVWLNPNYLPYYDQACSFNPYILTENEIIELARKQTPLIYDIECYINYFMVGFKVWNQEKFIYFELDANEKINNPLLEYIMCRCLTVGFNSNSYDNTIVTLAINKKTTQQLKAATNMIIEEDFQGWQVLRKLRCKKLKINHIDIIEVAPQSGNLKIYGGRAETYRMQDLPYPPSATLTEKQKKVTWFYCLRNDLQATEDLFNKLQSEIGLRYQMSAEYGVDSRSKSDAQIAELVIAHEIEMRTGHHPTKPFIEPGTIYKYRVPHYMGFKTPSMQGVLDVVRQCKFVVGENGSIITPEELKGYKVHIGNASYTMGIGGLHSNEKSQCVFATEGCTYLEIDVESYYPRIILNQSIYPQHLGQIFLAVFDHIVTTRLDAKHSGNKKVANSLKIVINGTFGKLGSKHSIFYSPDLLIQVTLSGQLTLMMLIEELELNGIPVVSGNTDGIVVKVPKGKEELRDSIVKAWEEKTRFKMEYTFYKAILSKDVNNYYAVKENGGVKRKGLYANPGLSKNPTATIAADAVSDYFEKGVSVETTIRNCKDISKFAVVRAVKGGGVAVKFGKFSDKPSYQEMVDHLTTVGWEPFGDHRWIQTKWKSEERNLYKDALMVNDAFREAKATPIEIEYLGKSIRWYYAVSENRALIVYAGSGNKVPKSEGAKPMMELPSELPDDLDYDWYINEARRIMKDVGYDF